MVTDSVAMTHGVQGWEENGACGLLFPGSKETLLMLRAAIVFFVIALIAMLFGMNNIAGVSADLGKILLFVFLALAVISFLVSLVGGKKTPRL